MKKFIAFISAVFLIGALSVPVMATEPADSGSTGSIIDALDRNSSWGGFIDKRTKTTSDKQSASATSEDKPVMNVKMEDKPWQRVG